MAQPSVMARFDLLPAPEQTAMAKQAVRLMEDSRTSLILQFPFWGALSLSLNLQADVTCETAWTDGASMGFHPLFVTELTSAKRIGLFAHELAHCALEHQFRREGRDNSLWNIATDHSVNIFLQDQGFELPDGGLWDRKYEGKSEEVIYAMLPAPDPRSGQPKPGIGEVRDPQEGPDGSSGDPGTPQPSGARKPSKGSSSAPEDDSGQDGPDGVPQKASGNTPEGWKQKVREAAQSAHDVGSLPGSLKRLLREVLRPRVDWKNICRQWMQDRAKEDYSWQRPSRRAMANDMILPSLRSESLPPVGVIIDTSGSVDGIIMDAFLAEARSIFDECKPEVIHVLCVDTKVNSHAEIYPGDEFTVEPGGGGGTSFEPGFRWFDQEGILPDLCAIIYLTDLEGSTNFDPPDGVPVLWACSTAGVAPWGTTIRIEL